MKHKTLRVPYDLADEITRRARVKGVPDADYYRALIERGLWIESAELIMDNPVPPRYWGLYEALLETRNILRALAAARDHGTVSAAQIQARDELERMRNDERRVSRPRASGQTPFAAPRSYPTGSSWAPAPYSCGSRSALDWADLPPVYGSSKALHRSSADCGSTMFAMPPASVGKSPICRIPMAAQRAFRCPRKRSQGAPRVAMCWSISACATGRFFGTLIAIGAAERRLFPATSGRTATEDRHIRRATLAPVETVVTLAKGANVAYDFTLAGVPLFREAETDHILVSGAPGSGKGVAIKELLDQIRARGDRAILYDPSGEYVQVYYRHGRNVLLNPLDARSPAWTLWGEVREAYDYASLAASIIPENEKVNDPFWREGPRGLFEAVALRLAQRGKSDQRGLPSHDLDRAAG